MASHAFESSGNTLEHRLPSLDIRSSNWQRWLTAGISRPRAASSVAIPPSMTLQRWASRGARCGGLALGMSIFETESFSPDVRTSPALGERAM